MSFFEQSRKTKLKPKKETPEERDARVKAIRSMFRRAGYRPVLLSLTAPQLSQLLDYVYRRDLGPDASWYYGNRKHFERRHGAILLALYTALENHPLVRGSK
jgi:hypothetical protein